MIELNPDGTEQWCELHEDLCDEVTPLRRRIGTRVELVLACPKCIEALHKAGLLKPAKWAKFPCLEIVAPDRRSPKHHRYPYPAQLSKFQACHLRALGFKVIRESMEVSK